MINIISGFPKNKVIGKGPDLPWHIPEDLKHFKEITTGKTIIMGLVTYKSIGKALPNRNNIVMSFNKIELNDAEVATSIDEALEIAKKYDKEIFIIGGASIYKLFLPITNKLYISHIKEEYEGDVYFPDFDEKEWNIEHEEDKGPFIFRIYKRNLI
jgi:dihydrofolate reductase